MPPIDAIAERERPLFCPSAAGESVHSGWAGKCYESFTLNDLLFAWSLSIFARVMTGRKHESRTATAGVFRLSALFGTKPAVSNTDFRLLTSEI
jgi:hypothetical protein